MHTTAQNRPLSRVLAVLGDIRPGEGRTASLMFAAVFSVMCAYYMVKPLREGWLAVSAVAGLSRIEIKAYSSLAQSLLLIGAVGAYARLAARVSQRTLLTRTSLVCAASLVAFWLLQPDFLLRALPGVAIGFYLWVGMFGVFIVAQFWAFAAELYSDDRGARLLPLIAIGGTAGAAAGSWLHGFLSGFGAQGAQLVLLLATLPVLAAAAFTRAAAARDAIAATSRASASLAGRGRRAATVGRSPIAGLRHVLADPFVLAAGLLALFLSWASTNGENLLFHAVQEGVARTAAATGLDGALALERSRAATTAFYGDFYFWTNLLALAAQLLLTSRLLKRGGLAAIIFALPMLALLASAVVAFAPALGILKWVKVAEQATDYSLNQTARQVLWLPASAEMKSESKPTVDALFVRIGDGLAALTVLASSHLAGHGTEVLIAVNVVLVVLWLVTTVVLVREHRRLVAARASASVERGPAVLHSVRGRLGRAVRRSRAAAAFRQWLFAPRDAVATVLALLPIGRGHPPPMLAARAAC